MMLSHPIRTVVDMTSRYAATIEIPELEHLSRAQLESVARTAERIDLAAGETLIGPGDSWPGAYVIMEGKALADVNGGTLLLGEGTCIARNDRRPAGFTVTACTDLRVLAIGRRALGGVPELRPDHDRRMYSLSA
jgi:CRP-like cAMP-binding protein